MRRPATSSKHKYIRTARILLCFSVFLLAAACNKSAPATTQTPTAQPAAPAANSPAATNGSGPAAKSGAEILTPIGNASARITKKFFGTYVTPQNSPVSPERFTGYHTGLDFETFPGEQNTDVPIKTICSGKLLQKGRASGYGGYAVQSCTVNSRAVTIIYGHLQQSSIVPSIGQELVAGDHLAMLGTGYSTETDGERKHLHLGIHIGTSVNIKGYVQNKSELSGWIDPQKVLSL